MIVGPAVHGEQVFLLPSSVEALINRNLGQDGFHPRLRREGCSGGSRIDCSFSSQYTAVIVQGQLKPARILKITILTDLLRDDRDAHSRDQVAEAAAVFRATMVNFDPELQPGRRQELLSNLTEAALAQGSSERDGIQAQYSLASIKAPTACSSSRSCPSDRA
jgi:hypothetical protein